MVCVCLWVCVCGCVSEFGCVCMSVFVCLHDELAENNCYKLKV